MDEFNALLEKLTQKDTSGGIHVPAEMRLLLSCLARLMHFETIVETGYDAGFTTLALSLSGASVTAVDNLTEYPYIDETARAMLNEYDNVELRMSEALTFLKQLDDESIDMAFIDDWHSPDHVEREAIELIRVLRPGGVAAFHDVRAEELYLWNAIISILPGWESIQLPAVSPRSGRDYGFALLRKPNGKDWQ